MSFVGLSPGNILQNLYLKERIKTFKKLGYKYFLEIGAGNGYISTILLKSGMQGIAIDLNSEACENNKKRNQSFITSHKYRVINDDFLTFHFSDKFDIIISYMVMEHLNDKELFQFITKSKDLLSNNGRLVVQVPASMKYWGIEDEIAGHVKRFEPSDLDVLANRFNFNVVHKAGLNYPLSNWLFKLSNKLVEKNEKEKLHLSQMERTVYTGNRNVPFKTKFPKIFNIILNPIALYPFHLLQKCNIKRSDCMVIYAEFENKINEI